MTDTYLQVGPLTIDDERHEARMSGRRLHLAPTEFALLKHLAQHTEKVFTRDQLMTALWGEDRFIEEDDLDAHIHTLKQELEQGGTARPCPLIIITVQSVGYTLHIRSRKS
jgi:DNA-binding response OmpR family regulator